MMGQTDGRTDGRSTVPYTTRAAPIIVDEFDTSRGSGDVGRQLDEHVATIIDLGR